MNVQGNQGSRPNYLSTLSPIQLPNLPYIEDTHQQWIVSRHLRASHEIRHPTVLV